jgi:glycosyltransferase involved in cell wall biosynthesis
LHLPVRRPARAPRARGLRFVATTNLNNNLLTSLVAPLVALPEVAEVVWVTDSAGPPLPKVRYVTPRRPVSSHLGRLLLRLPVLAWEIARTRPYLVMGYNLNPHGLVVYGLGRLFGRRVAIHLLGGPNEIRGGGYFVDKRLTRPNRALEALFLAVIRRTDLVTGYGSGARAYLLAQGVDPARIHIISSKVDTTRFQPRPTAPCAYDLIIAATLIPLKRVDLFLRVVAALRPRFPAIRAAILGDGPLRGELEALAAELGITENVTFLGFRENMEDYYNQAKIFVLTSTTEGISVAMMEAMACGRPAVVTAVGDLPDLARDDETGYLVHPPEEPGFVAALTRLLEDDALRDRLGATARRTIVAEYSQADGSRRWRAALRGLRRGGRPAPG